MAMQTLNYVTGKEEQGEATRQAPGIVPPPEDDSTSVNTLN